MLKTGTWQHRTVGCKACETNIDFKALKEVELEAHARQGLGNVLSVPPLRHSF